MPTKAHPEVRTLQDLRDDLDKIVGHAGPRGGFYAADRRTPGQAPTFAQWALHHGLKLDSLGTTQKASWEKTFRRALEADLAQVFGESNWELTDGVEAHAADFLGYDQSPEGTPNLKAEGFKTKWNSRESAPKDLREAVALLLQVKVQGERVRSSWASKKKRSGRRTGGCPPTFVQWAAAAHVSGQLSRVFSSEKDGVRRLFDKTIEAELRSMFWPAHGETFRTRRHSAAGSLRQKADSVRARGSFVGDAYRDRCTQRRQRGGIKNNELIKWTKGRFTDFSEGEAQDFVQRFPQVQAKAAIHIGNSVWDKRTNGGQLTNFTKFLRRLAAYTVIKRVRPTLTSAEVHDTIFHDLNSLFNIVKAAVSAKTRSSLDPLEFIARLPTMPGLLTTDKAALKTIFAAIDDKFKELMSQDAFMDELAARVQLGGTRRQEEPLKNIVDRITREEGAAFVERKHGAAGAAGNRFALDANRTPAPATLDALQNVQFGLPSTNKMVRTKLRKGTEGFNPAGAGFFGAQPHGGLGPLRTGVDHNTQQLIRQIANELVAARSCVPNEHGRARRSIRGRDRQASLTWNRRGGER